MPVSKSDWHFYWILGSERFDGSRITTRSALSKPPAGQCLNSLALSPPADFSGAKDELARYADFLLPGRVSATVVAKAEVLAEVSEAVG